MFAAASNEAKAIANGALEALADVLTSSASTVATVEAASSVVRCFGYHASKQMHTHAHDVCQRTRLHVIVCARHCYRYASRPSACRHRIAAWCVPCD